MASTKEIKNRISSVQDTQKITNAMYLIASAKLRRAKAELDATRPYFEATKSEIKRIFRTAEGVQSKYFYPSPDEHDLKGDYLYLVITADRGLAGAYNQNVLREAERMMKLHDGARLFVVGEYGRQYFNLRNIEIDRSFLYTAQNPTFNRAREIASLLLDLYDRREVSKIFVIYTDYGNGLSTSVNAVRLLPFHLTQFTAPEGEKVIHTPFEFQPSVQVVLDNIIPSYISGFIYSALVDSFCCEQNARMTAMDAANRNAEKLIAEMKLEYNHIRQESITNEITEVSAGAKYHKLKREQKAKERLDRVRQEVASNDKR